MYCESDNCPLYSKYECLVLVVDDIPTNYYISRRLCINTDKYKFVEPFLAYNDSIYLNNIYGLSMTDSKITNEVSYKKSVKIQIYSCKPIEYLEKFDIFNSILEREFTINFERLNKDKKYTQGEFSFDNENGITIKKGDKNYGKMYVSVFLTSPTSLLTTISQIIFF